MNIQYYYKYSQFSALAYVDWKGGSWGAKLNIDNAIFDANSAKRIPGNSSDAAINTLG